MKVDVKVVVAAARQVASGQRCSGSPHSDDIGDAFEEFAKLIAEIADREDDECKK